MAIVHADAVLNYVQKLNCPTWQKIKLIDAIIEDAKKEAKAKVENERDRDILQYDPACGR